MHSKKETYIYSPENAISGDSSLSLGRKLVSLTRVWSVLWGKQIAAYMLVSPRRTSTHQRRGQRWEGMKVWHQKWPCQDCWHFSAALDCKIPWGLHHRGYVIILFWSRDQIAKFKNTAFWPKSPNLIPAKFPAKCHFHWKYITELQMNGWYSLLILNGKSQIGRQGFLSFVIFTIQPRAKRVASWS